MKDHIKYGSSFVLPVTVLLIIPLLIEENVSVKAIYSIIAGLILICCGLFMMAVTISAFAKKGKGTLAPWNPTKNLVITGLYAHVRNPMITGVLSVLLGEAIALWSLRILIWAVIFFAINHIYFLLYEEKDLERKFGEEYRDYKRNVPRWIPRVKGYL